MTIGGSLRRCFLAPTALLLLAPNLLAKQTSSQTTASPTQLTFDAVSIRENKSGSATNIQETDDGFIATNVDIETLLTFAYDYQEDHIYGLPSWARSVHYDVNAKVTDPDRNVLKSLSDKQRQAMLAAMLADRFHLRAHVEDRTLPVYDLVIAKDGPRLKDTKFVTQPGGLSGTLTMGPSSIGVIGLSAGATAHLLQRLVGRNVIDKTGLTGRYDFTLKWRPDNATPDNNAPDIFTALQEQLGLKLEPSKGPVDTLVVDHVQMPTEN